VPILNGTPHTKRRSTNITELRGSSCPTSRQQAYAKLAANPEWHEQRENLDHGLTLWPERSRRLANNAPSHFARCTHPRAHSAPWPRRTCQMGSPRPVVDTSETPPPSKCRRLARAEQYPKPPRVRPEQGGLRRVWFGRGYKSRHRRRWDRRQVGRHRPCPVIGVSRRHDVSLSGLSLFRVGRPPRLRSST
jgi:hypothetical protein